MTTDEHRLMILMFARLHESLEAINETLSSRGIWAEDDKKAFRDLAHHDDRKIENYLAQAGRDYLKLAKELGVETGIEDELLQQ